MKKTGIMPVALQHQNYSGDAMPVDLCQIRSCLKISVMLSKKESLRIAYGQRRTTTDGHGQKRATTDKSSYAPLCRNRL